MSLASMIQHAWPDRDTGDASVLASRADIGKTLQAGDSVFSRRIILTALIKGDRVIRDNIIERVEPRYFGHSHFRSIFRWIMDEIHSGDQVEVQTLYKEMVEYVRRQWLDKEMSETPAEEETFEQVLPGYIAVIGHLLAIEMPDQQMISDAIHWLERRYPRH
jgi:hypothetical protein